SLGSGTVAREPPLSTGPPPRGVADERSRRVGRCRRRGAAADGGRWGVMAALDNLLSLANAAVTNYSGSKRPTRAPPLVLGDDLVDLLRSLGWLETNE